MSRRRRQTEPDAMPSPPSTENPPEPEYVPPADGPSGEELAEIVIAVDPTFPALRAEYDRLAAQVTKAKPTDPGYKELRAAKKAAFETWHTAVNP